MDSQITLEPVGAQDTKLKNLLDHEDLISVTATDIGHRNYEGWYWMLVQDSSTNKTAGYAAIEPYSHNSVRIHGGLLKEFRGSGFALKATANLIQALEDTPGLKVVLAEIPDFGINKGPEELVKALGFTLVGKIPLVMRHLKEDKDLVVYYKLLKTND